MKSAHPLIEFMLLTKGTGAASAEILWNILERFGFPREKLTEYSSGNQVAVSVYLRSQKKAAALKAKVGFLRLRQVQVRIKELLPKQWQEKWKENIRPFALTKDFAVVPVWHRRGFDPGKRTAILIDTTLAFGTGLHETTRFMAQTIEATRGKWQTFLDVGTGTGLLAIVAAHCGATRIVALDVDSQSVTVAKRNLEINSVQGSRVLRKDFAKFKPAVQFDFVAANLITDDLIAFRKKLAACVRPKGFLAVSGISLNNLRRLRKSFRGLPLRCVRVQKGKQWSAILYQRS